MKRRTRKNILPYQKDAIVGILSPDGLCGHRLLSASKAGEVVSTFFLE